MCNVVGASVAHKIVKIDYIALQCKSLKVKYIYTESKIDRNGCDWVTESAHTKWTMSEGSGDHIAYGVPHSPAGLQSKIINKVLDKLRKV